MIRTRTRTRFAALAAAAVGIMLSTTGQAAHAAPVPDEANGSGPATHGQQLPSSFHWRSSDILLSPKPDASHQIVSVKDPTIVRYKGQWLVYSTTANTAGNWSLEYRGFRNWTDAPSATPSYLDTNPNIRTGYRAAPQVFYFAPGRTWYLVYQTGAGPSYSTTTDPTKPETWSAPRNFLDGMPDIIRENIGNGYWVYMWVICDNVNCYLFEASNVYRVKGSNTYLLLVEAFGAHGRYFRSWTSDSIAGTWTPLADTEDNPFAGFNNVTFSGTPWTTSISHGEMIRDGYDQSLTIDPRHLQYLYQGLDPSAGGSYSQLPWRLGLLTQTSCPD